MSDMPESYFLNGKELLGFRREPNLSFIGISAPGEVEKKKRSRSKSKGPVKRSYLIQRDGMICHYCKCKMILPRGAFDGGPNAASVEHIVPKSEGGSNEVFNLVLACRRCNNGFGSQMIKCACDFCEEALRRYYGAQGIVSHRSRL